MYEVEIYMQFDFNKGNDFTAARLSRKKSAGKMLL